jgi:hypothetical protein
MEEERKINGDKKEERTKKEGSKEFGKAKEEKGRIYAANYLESCCNLKQVIVSAL